jgi:hypothetical protein
MLQSRWETLRKKFRIATLPITAAKLEAISNIFRCAVTQELLTAPAVTPMCCKQNIGASQLKACFSKMDVSSMCPLCRTDLTGVRSVVCLPYLDVVGCIWIAMRNVCVVLPAWQDRSGFVAVSYQSRHDRRD